MKLATIRLLLRIALTTAFLPLMSSCGPPTAPMTPTEVASHGTRTFQAPHAQVFNASLGALRTLGYEIAVSDPETGVIKTAPKSLAALGGYGVVVIIAHAYTLRLSKSNDATLVEAQPKLFRSGNDVSTEPWVLEGPGGQYDLWEKLFAEIASNVVVPPKTGDTK